MSSRNITIAVIGILIVIAVGWFLMQPKQATTPAPVVPVVTETPSSTESAGPSASEGANLQEKNIVEIAASGFSPKNITIQKGESVTWKNTDSADHIINSAPHPIHTTYPPLNLGVIKPGDQKSLTFPDSGTYKYHDHLNPSLFGSVTVQ